MSGELLVRSWVLFGLRGLAFVSLGLLVVFYPGLTPLTLVSYFCVYALTDALIAFVIALRVSASLRILFLLLAVTNVGAGVFAFLNPIGAYLLLILCVGPWAIVCGTLHIVAAISQRNEVGGTKWLLLGGMLSVALGTQSHSVR